MGCEKADLSQKVMCCTGKVQVIVLAGIFLFLAITTGGLLGWQVEVVKDFMSRFAKMKHEKEPDMNFLYALMAIPGVMFISALCLLAMLKVNPKLLLIICIIWPVLSSCVPGGASALFYIAMKKATTDSQVFLDQLNEQKIYLFYIVPASTVGYILSAIYCIVLLVCLGCCQRPGAGHDDLYVLEWANRDDIESSTKTHISIE